MLPIAIAARSTLAALLVLGGTLSALADPPGRVGRLSYMEGTVSFHAGDQDQWSAAVLNYPVTSGTAFWTEPEARAEIQIGGAEVRLDQSTELDIVRLDDDGTRLHVGQGVVNVHLRSVPRGGIHVVTPHSEADLLEAGSYRIDAGVARRDGLPERVQIVVLEGEARINEPRASLDIRPGESAVIGGDPVSFTLIEARTTPFDDWSLMRERRELISESAQYVSPDVTGYEDLDRSGHWRTSPRNGAVWYPTAIPAGWAPYRYGHWAYVQPWGWTWVDDASWGFAPFHYGRWVNDDRGWGWHPGERVAEAVYAPALVAFIGGAGWGVSLSVGNAAAVGWVPLAPSEVFHPYYPTSANYVRNVNINNVTTTEINNITVNNTTVNNFANQQAATVVPSTAFIRAAPVQQVTLVLPKEQLAQVPVTAKVDHLQPTFAARAGMARPAARQASAPGANTPATVAQGPVVAQASPGAAAPVTADPPAPKAPGPAISAKIPASVVAQPAPEATTPRAAAIVAPAPGPSVVAPASHAPSPAPNLPPIQSPATPVAPAAPGPPIAHADVPSSAAAAPVAPATANNATPSAPAKPLPSAAPGPPIAHATAAPPAGASPVAPAPLAAGAAPQSPGPSIAPLAEKHSGTSAPPQITHAEPAAPIHVATPPPPAPSPAIAHPSPPAAATNTPPPAERPSPVAPQQVAHAPVIPHPVQQTQIAPTPSGWVRTPAPTQPTAPHAAAPPPAAPVQPAHVAPAPAPPPAAPHADPAKKSDQTKDKPGN
jgi:hypothetical protein